MRGPQRCVFLDNHHQFCQRCGRSFPEAWSKYQDAHDEDKDPGRILADLAHAPSLASYKDVLLGISKKTSPTPSKDQMWKDASKAVEAAVALKNKPERQSHALANKMDKAAEAIKQYNLEWLKLQDDLEAASRSLAKAKQDKEALLQMASD